MSELSEEYCLRYVLARKQSSYDAKRNRMLLNEDNFAMYQLEHNFDHKKKGQSKEVLSKVRNATESSKAFFQQALADLDDWFRVEAMDGSDGSAMLIRPHEMQKVLNYMLERADYFSHIGYSVQLGLLGSLAIARVRGCMVPKPAYKTKSEGRGRTYKKSVVVSDEKVWELRFDNLRQEDYYPDPDNLDFATVTEYDLDFHTVRELAEGPDAIYDKEAVDGLTPWGDADLQKDKQARETGQNLTHSVMRPKIRITEFYGNVVDEKTGEMLAEKVYITLANHTKVIRKPTPNPLWHQQSDIVAAALIEFAKSPWGVAMMDAGTKHNRSLIEIFNLMLDSAMKAVWGVNQIRVDNLQDTTQITDGIPWGTNLKIDSSLPPGAKVMEPVVTGEIPGDVITMFNLLMQETLTSMKTNDLRMGAQSMRAVKATEVVAAENSINSEFQGIAKNFEQKFVRRELELSTWTIAQNWDQIDKEVFKSLFGPERGEQLAQLEPQDVFVATVAGMKFDVYGISLTLRRQADFRKWTTLLQTIGSSEVLLEAFLSKYSFEKLLGEIMTAIDLNKSKIENDQQKAAGNEVSALQQSGGAPGASPDTMSQVPSAANQPGGGGLAAAFSGVGNQMNMPSSQAIR